MKKPTVILALLFALFLCSSCEKEEEKCVATEPQFLCCFMEINEICGCDGVTYYSVCEAESVGIYEYTFGKCEGER